MSETKGSRFSIRDIITVAAMLVINYMIAMIIGTVTLPISELYLYGSAGIEGFLGAVFFLVAANRVNKHGLLFIWAVVFGLIQALMGYAFLLPYFIVVGIITELSMIGKDTYRKPVRNMIGWALNNIGNAVGCAVPLWWSWESYKEMALKSGFSQDTLNKQFLMTTHPLLMLLVCAVTGLLAVLGALFGQRILRRHFQKAGILE